MTINNLRSLALAEPQFKLQGIASAIGAMQRTLERGIARPTRVSVELDALRKADFFPPLFSNDVCSLGGLFVATYERPPALGAAGRAFTAISRGPEL